MYFMYKHNSFLILNSKKKAHCSYKPELPGCFLSCLVYCFVAAFLHTVLGQCRNSTEPKRLPTTEEEQIYPWDTCGALHDVRLTTLQRYFRDVSISYEQYCHLRKICVKG